MKKLKYLLPLINGIIEIRLNKDNSTVYIGHSLFTDGHITDFINWEVQEISAESSKIVIYIY